MSLRFGDRAHFVHKLKRLAKVREGKCPRDVMCVDYLPVRQLLGELFQLLAGQGRDASPARHTRLVCESGHEVFPSSNWIALLLLRIQLKLNPCGVIWHSSNQ